MIFWEHILRKLKDGQQIYVLTVIENFGSSPGRKGFKMLVAADQFIYGSVGGGVMEFSLVEEAQVLLSAPNPPSFIKKQIHKGNIKDGSGMICSGEQTVAFSFLNSNHISIIQELILSLKNGEKRMLHLGPSVFKFSKEEQSEQFDYQINSKEDWYFKETIGFKETLYIVGGGHVGVAVSKLFRDLGFYVVVFDNRENLNTLENNTSAHQKIIIDYHKIADHIPSTRKCFIAIMTNKYTDDKLVVQKLIYHPYFFIGVLGSKAKLKTLRKELLKEGFSSEALDRLHAPIGLSIKSETPEEIAVSIAAEIIQVKNKGRK